MLFAPRKMICALRHTFTPKRASQKFGVEQKMTLRGANHAYQIDP